MNYFHRCIYLINSPVTTDLVSTSGIFLDVKFFGGDADHSYERSPDPNNEQDLRVITFIGSVYAQHNAIRNSYGLQTRIVMIFRKGLIVYIEMEILMKNMPKFSFPTVIKTRE